MLVWVNLGFSCGGKWRVVAVSVYILIIININVNRLQIADYRYMYTDHAHEPRACRPRFGRIPLLLLLLSLSVACL
jgi:hypothetical protein